MREVKSMKREWIWGVPVLIGIAVGVMLWDMNSFNVGAVIGAWVFIFVVMAIYILIISNLPVSETDNDDQLKEMTPVQRHYVNVTSLSVKKHIEME